MHLPAGVVPLFVVLVSLTCVFSQLAVNNVSLSWTIPTIQQYDYDNPLNLNLGDDLIFLCENGSFANVFYLPRRDQFDNCNGNLGENSERPVSIGGCFQGGQELLVKIQESSSSGLEFLNMGIYFFASFSDGNSMNSALNVNQISGGRCNDGLKFAVKINPFGTPGSGGLSGALGSNEIIAIAASCSAFLLIIIVIVVVVLCVHCCKRKRSVSMERGNSVVPSSNGYKLKVKQATKDKDLKPESKDSEKKPNEPENQEIKPSNQEKPKPKVISEQGVRRPPPGVPNGHTSHKEGTDGKDSVGERNVSNARMKNNQEKNERSNSNRPPRNKPNNSQPKPARPAPRRPNNSVTVDSNKASVEFRK